MNQKTKAYIALGVVSFVWGTTYLAMRTGVQHMPGLMLAAIRNTISGIIVITWFLIKGYRIPDYKTLLRLGIIGVLLLGFGNGLMCWGEQTVPSGLASVLAAVNPMCMALFSLMLIRGTRLSPLVITGLILGLAGIFIIFFPLLMAPLQTGLAFGAMLIVIGVLGWSSGSVYAAKQKISLNIFYACGWEFLLGGIALGIASSLTGHTILLAAIDKESWLSIAYLIALGSLVGYSAYQYALNHLPTAQVAIYGYINPIVALFLGWMVLHERLNGRIFIGAVVTLAGIYLVQRSYNKIKRSLMQRIPEKKKSHLPRRMALHK
jgi:drug/metabolite transporter (DMT)-like permease